MCVVGGGGREEEGRRRWGMEIRRTIPCTAMAVLNLSGKVRGRDEEKLEAETRWCMMTVGGQNTQYDNDGLRAECLLTCLSG